MDYIIGVDFDNTIVSYDELIYKVAVQQKLIQSTVAKSKKQVRDQIRQLPSGEIVWQKVQALVYGPRMNEAKLIKGVQQFFAYCNQHGFRVYVVSHKTEYANYDETNTNLRKAALDWMAKNKFFEADGLGLSPEDVYFGSTRRQKIEHIKRLGCSHFIDDLEEMFLEASFPANVKKILYAPHIRHTPLSDVQVMSSWTKISDYFFGRS